MIWNNIPVTGDTPTRLLGRAFGDGDMSRGDGAYRAYPKARYDATTLCPSQRLLRHQLSFAVPVMAGAVVN